MHTYTWKEFTEDIINRVHEKQKSIKVKVFDTGGEIVRMNFSESDFSTYTVFDKRLIDRERAKECAMNCLYSYQLWAEENLKSLNWSVYEA